jgi:hypothetical protein
MLTMKDKKRKFIPNCGDIHYIKGCIEGVMRSYQAKSVSAELAMDDIKDIIDFYNVGRDKGLNETLKELGL